MLIAPPDRYALNWLLAATAFAMLPLLAHVPLWLSSAVGILLVWRYLVAHHRWPAPQRWLRIVVTLTLGLAIFKAYGTLLGRDAGIALLLGLIALKLWELRTRRDFMVSVFLLYVLVLGAFLYSQNLWLGVFLVLAVVLTTATLYRLQYAAPVAPAQRLRLAGELVLKALPLVVVLYLLFPRLTGGLWGLPHDAYDGLTGMSDTMRPGSVLNLGLSQDVAFRIEPASALPPSAQRYWRVLVLDHTDGEAWSRSPLMSYARGAQPQSYTALGAPVHYTITAEPSNEVWLAALEMPATVSEEMDWLPGYVLQARAPVRERLRYTVSSYPQHRTGPAGPGELDMARRLPAQTSDRVRSLAQSWRALAGGQATGVVDQALRYFRQEPFGYTLQPPPLGDDPVDDFLFRTRRGFCEHYASAFATLMRAADIPSRVVVGYQGGEDNPTGNYTIVRQADAHAWVEVWLEGRGWVRVDPTTAVAPERVEHGIDAVRRLARQGLAPRELPGEALIAALRPDALERWQRRTRLAADAINNSWNQWVLDYGPAGQRRFLQWLGFATPTWLGMAAGLAGLIALMLFVLAAWLLRVRPFVDPAQAAYLAYCQKLAATGLTRAPHEDARVFARRCACVRPDLAEEIAAITERYVALRYGPPADATQLYALRDRVKAFRPRRA
jgi:transglutaminase-like putative cysteine protease